MSRWQIIEREGVTSEWAVPRNPKTVEQFDTEEGAVKVARDYVTDVNVDNALAAGEKETAAEVFLLDKKGVYLGELDGKPWYMLYKKNEYNRDRTKVLHKMGEVVQDTNYYELEKKGEVAVRKVPGT